MGSRVSGRCATVVIPSPVPYIRNYGINRRISARRQQNKNQRSCEGFTCEPASVESEVPIDGNLEFSFTLEISVKTRTHLRNVTEFGRLPLSAYRREEDEGNVCQYPQIFTRR